MHLATLPWVFLYANTGIIRYKRKEAKVFKESLIKQQ